MVVLYNIIFVHRYWVCRMIFEQYTAFVNVAHDKKKGGQKFNNK